MKRACNDFYTKTDEQKASSLSANEAGIRPLKNNFVRMKKNVFTLLLFSLFAMGASSQTMTIHGTNSTQSYPTVDVNSVTLSGDSLINVNTSVAHPIRMDTIRKITFRAGPNFVMFAGDTLWVHPTDNSDSITWGAYGLDITAGNGAESDTNGYANTKAIVAEIDSGAAYLCDTLTAYGFDDWYLPAKADLNALWMDTAAIGGFSSYDYWSSTENSNVDAWLQSFDNGNQKDYHNKDSSNRVRCVRRSASSFSIDTPQVFCVTSDLISNRNIIVWEKQASPIIDHYKIYRETAIFDVYDSIGFVNYSAASVFYDDQVDVSTQSHKYKITAVGTSGTESSLSNPHETILLQYAGNTGGINLTWTAYVGNTGMLYYIYRGMDSLSLNLYDSVSTAMQSYTDADENAQTNRYYYRVGLKLSTTCSVDTNSYNIVYSNLEDNRLQGLGITLNNIQHASCNNSCDGSIDLTISGGASPYAFTWSNGDNTEDISALCAGNYSVTVTDDGGAKATDNFTIYQPDPVMADFYYTDTVSIVSFTNMSMGATSHYWNFGDGQVSSEAYPSHEYDNSGTYEVCLSVSDSLGCSNDTCMDVFVGVTPVNVTASFYTEVLDSANHIIGFVNTSSNYTSASWTFGDGSYYQGTDTSHQYVKPGKYTVTLNIFDQNSGQSKSVSKTITIGSVPCDLDADFNTFVDPATNSISLANESKGHVNKLYWTFGDGGSAAGNNPSHTYNRADFYLVTLAIRDTLNNCADYEGKFIQVGQVDCHADFETNITDMANREMDMINKSTGQAYIFYWEYGDGNNSSQYQPTHAYNAPGMYPVSLTVRDSAGMCMDNTTKEVQLGSVSCNADFSVFVDSTTNTVDITNNSVGDSIVSYWVFGDGSTSTDFEPSHTFTAPGYYTIDLTVFNPNTGSMDHASQKVLIAAQDIDCEADFIHTTDNATGQVNFSDRSTGDITSYFWNFGDGDVLPTANKQTNHEYTEDGIYNVCLTAYAGNVSNMTCKEVEIAKNQKPIQADFIHSDIQDEVRFTNKSNGDYNAVMWYFDGEDSTIVNNPAHSFANTGDHLVTLKIENTATGQEAKKHKLVRTGTSEQRLACRIAHRVNDRLKAQSYPVDFVGVSHGDASKLKWNFGDGNYDSTTTNPTHIYTSPGEYDVCLTIEDPVTGDTAQHCETIKVGNTAIEETPGEDELNETALTIHPNPAGEYFYINYTLQASSLTTISLIAPDGSKVAGIINKTMPKGTHKVLYDGSYLPAGVYYVKMISNSDLKVKKVIIE
jgi:PKD repeat protein